MDAPDLLRRVRICRPAFQDLHHLVMPRLVARAQFRRHALKLRFWGGKERPAPDLECGAVSDERLFVAELADGFGLADGFRFVFCDGPNPEPVGTICVLAVLRAGEPLTGTTLAIIRGRERIARERLCG